VKAHADRLGIQLEVGVSSVCPSSVTYNRKVQGDAVQYALTGLRVARDVGSKVMRCYQGSRGDRRGALPIEAHMENTIKVFRAVRSQALDMGVKIGIENHAGDMQAREVRTIIEEAGKDFVGACVDSGNPLWAVEDPMVTLEILGPYAVTTHVRDSAVFEHPRGAAVQWVALGDGSVDFARYMQLHRQLCPHAFLQLEIITGRRPDIVPYLEPDFWKAFPKTPAAEFARFVALAKNGRPYLGSMLMAEGKPSAALQEALREQQRNDLQRSLEYARKTLGAGLKWKN
jgi:3-oxoisoapionate decarboxylase